MRGVGDKSTPLDLIRLKAFCQVIEFSAQFADFIFSSNTVPIAVVTCGDNMHAAGERIQTAKNDVGKYDSQQKCHRPDYERKNSYSVLDVKENIGPLRVVFIETDGSGYSAFGSYRN